MRKSIKHISLIFFLLFLFSDIESFSQQNINSASENITSDAKREEIQRYFGYELLLYRYLSLPYDVSINVNQHGNFVDIGILYLLFIPVLIVLLLRRRIWIQILTIVYLFFTWIISTSNAFIFSASSGKISSDQSLINNYLESQMWKNEFLTFLVAKTYSISLTLYKPFEYIANIVSGDSDYVTYPIIFTAFILISLGISKFLDGKNIYVRGFIAFLWIYSFYWFAFSGGIVWYGYITLLLGVLLIPILIRMLDEENKSISKFIQKAFIIAGSVWIIVAIVYRTSDVNPWIDKRFFAKGIFNPVYYDYATGKIDKRKSLDLIYADFSSALDKINSDKNSIVLRIGTSFGYFIERNHERVVIDNQLGMFHELYKRYPDKMLLTDVFKASNIKYIFLDLNTATIDNTPDKSLTNKYREVLIYLINNPQISLLSTDRVVGVRDANGQLVPTRTMIGETVYQNGRYAIFEII